MQQNNSSYSVVTIPPFAPELFDDFAQTCVKAAAKIAYYTAFEHIDSGRLTKKFLMSAPAGSYLASNCYCRTAMGSKPVFAEVVSDSVEDRLQQWSKIKSVGADDRKCYLHKSRDAYEQLNALAEFGHVMQS